MLGVCICPGDSHVATGSPTIIHFAIAATRTSRRYRSRNAILGGGDRGVRLDYKDFRMDAGRKGVL